MLEELDKIVFRTKFINKSKVIGSFSNQLLDFVKGGKRLFVNLFYHLRNGSEREREGRYLETCFVDFKPPTTHQAPSIQHPASYMACCNAVM